jgi:hypothetical protein
MVSIKSQIVQPKMSKSEKSMVRIIKISKNKKKIVSRQPIKNLETMLSRNLCRCWQFKSVDHGANYGKRILGKPILNRKLNVLIKRTIFLF